MNNIFEPILSGFVFLFPTSLTPHFRNDPSQNENPCPICFSYCDNVNAHIRVCHKVRNDNETDVLTQLSSGRLSVRTEPCPICRLDRHLKNTQPLEGHRETQEKSSCSNSGKEKDIQSVSSATTGCSAPQCVQEVQQSLKIRPSGKRLTDWRAAWTKW